MYYFLQIFLCVTIKLMTITTFLFLVKKITIIESKKKKKTFILT